ncbi:hypothetical protein [Cecembia rubra]|uniref:NnrS protein n=1 Tax=Cecembia rubra TaxID=1485585 RepID=A0A2P8EE98_9BACT|nr:hypothetical protein [Cecembia rubra]PSL07763.1 hypothetical protein CLV48_101701 [Cecembia rubra]
MNSIKPIFLFPLVILGLIAGISGGGIRLGYTEFQIPEAAANHGIWMVGGFLGTLISLERAMVMKQRIWLLVPLICGMSVPLMMAGWTFPGKWTLLIASMGLLAIMYLQTLKHPALHQFIMSLGAVFWMAGNFVLIQTGLVAAATTWWIGFILFTIIGERLELSKFLPTPKWAKNALHGLLALFLIGIWTPFHQHGNWLMGASAIFISFWLLHFDMAKIASKKANQYKFIGIGLRVGYVWLTLNGIILLFFQNHIFYYDLYLHTFFLGFTFSMIWAHAPIILPMVLNIKESPYHLVIWPFWGFFQLTLLGRILSSIFEFPEMRKAFGVLNAWSILLIFVTMATIVISKNLRGKYIMRKASILSGNKEVQG